MLIVTKLSSNAPGTKKKHNLTMLCSRYSSHRRFSPRRYRSPPPRGRTPPRFSSPFLLYIESLGLFMSCASNIFGLNNMIIRTLLCRYRSRRSRTPSVSRSPRYRGRRYSRSLSRSPVRSRSPVETYRSRPSPRMEKRRSPSRSRSRSLSQSRSSVESQSPRKASKDRSRSSSRSSDGKKGLVSYGDGSPYSDQR